MPVLKWMLTHHHRKLESAAVLRAAARGGQVGVLVYLHHEFECDDDAFEDGAHACEAAAAAGQLGSLQWLRGRGFAWSASVLTEAARGGHLELIRWALEHECPQKSWWQQDDSYHTPEHPLKAALEAGQLGLCTWIMREGPAALRGQPRFTPSELRRALTALALPTAGTVTELTERLDHILRERKVGLSVRADTSGGLWV